jgi:hypothetical protein
MTRSGSTAPGWAIAWSVAAALMSSTCSPRPIVLPTGPARPMPDYARAFDEASAGCRDVRTMTAELSLSGRAASQKLRGRIIAGLERPGSMRLEGVAPFGQPVFIMAARAGRATLLLPRDGRVLADAPPAAVLEALAGIPLEADDLLAILSGCLSADPQPLRGRAYAGGWSAVDLAGGVTAYLRQEGDRWRIRAGTRERLTIEYTDFDQHRARRIRLRKAGGASAATADLTLDLSQVDTNVAIDPKAFSVLVPAGTVPLTVEELRRQGPLGNQAEAVRQ